MTTVRIPRVLQERCSGQAEVQVPGGTVRQILRSLKMQFPPLYQCICDETGSVRQHINLFINDDFLHDRDGLDTKLKSDDVVSVFQAVSGG